MIGLPKGDEGPRARRKRESSTCLLVQCTSLYGGVGIGEEDGNSSDELSMFLVCHRISWITTRHSLPCSSESGTPLSRSRLELLQYSYAR